LDLEFRIERRSVDSERGVVWQVCTLHVSLNPGHLIIFSPDGKRVLSVSWDEVVQIWDAETGAQVSSVLLRY